MFDPRDCGIENNPAYYYDINSLKKYGGLWHEKREPVNVAMHLVITDP
jgi:hypothetical protein